MIVFLLYVAAAALVWSFVRGFVGAFIEDWRKWRRK